MSYYINRITIVGNLGQDPEFSSFGNNQEFCRLSVSTSRFWLDPQTKEQKQETQWHRVIVFDQRLVQTCRTLQKGSYVFVEGEMRYSSYEDKQGVKRYSSDIHPTSLVLMQRPVNDNAGNYQQNRQGFNNNRNQNVNNANSFAQQPSGFANQAQGFANNGFNNANSFNNQASFNNSVNQASNQGFASNVSFAGNMDNSGFANNVNTGFNSPTSAASSFNGAFGSQPTNNQYNQQNNNEDSVASKVNEKELPF